MPAQKANPPLFEYSDNALGKFTLNVFDIETQIELLHSWTSKPYAQFWGMQKYSLTEVKAEQQKLAASGTSQILGYFQNKPAFFVEIYSPREHPLAEKFQVNADDLGMHILLAPAEQIVSGFSYAAMCCVLEYLFNRLNTARVIVEPDSRNSKIHALNRRVGFVHHDIISLPEKHAAIASCSSAQFYAAKYIAALEKQNSAKSMGISRVNHEINPVVNPEHTDFLQSPYWQKANRHLVCKALSEFLHERLLEVKISGSKEQATSGLNREPRWQKYYVASPNLDAVESATNTSKQKPPRYHFRAQRLPLNHWYIDPASICKEQDDRILSLDAAEFILEFQLIVGISNDMLADYLAEINSTLYSLSWKFSKPVGVNQLIDNGFQAIEAAMIEGHPCFVANSGRIGFDCNDFSAFSPESAAPIRLLWLAAHRNHCDFNAIDDLTEEQLLNGELDCTTRQEFNQKLESLSLEPKDYIFIPAHPWQWNNRLSTLFANDIATHKLVLLGVSDDAYQAQQSIRTFFNNSQPNKYYVKTALSIINMGFMRGLSSAYMAVTPAINQWVNEVVAEDDYLQKQKFKILRELAAAGYRQPHFNTTKLAKTPWNKMLATLWRENPMNLIEPKQELMTMAALLHIDTAGDAMLAALINRSELSIEEWLSRYLQAYLAPLLHCFYRYDMVFMPHGENLILVMEDHVPVSVFLKDIGEEVCLLNSDQALPEMVKRIAVKVPKDVAVLSIFTDMFDCFFRFMSQILWQHCNFSPQHFWQLVGDCIRDYQAANPELSKKFEQHDLFIEEFPLSCLNRLQLANNEQMVDLTDPAGALQYAGRLVNPISPQANRANPTSIKIGLPSH